MPIATAAEPRRRLALRQTGTSGRPPIFAKRRRHGTIHRKYIAPNPIAISTYSFWRFNDDSKLDMAALTWRKADLIQSNYCGFRWKISAAYLQVQTATVNGLSFGCPPTKICDA
jgi:hypothetical protein